MDIQKYQLERNYIINELELLEKEKFYENNQGSASVKTIATNIKETFINLMKNIEEDADGVGERIKMK